MSESRISVRQLEKAYGVHSVLKGISFDVEPGTIFALLGENGAGKTTTVKILSTLIPADSGTAVIGGYDSRTEPNAVRRIISVTGQYAAIDELLTGEENLMMMGRLQHLSKARAATRAQELLEQFDLVEAKSRLVRTYSGGMRRRIDIAASLIAEPSILFLDEPTTGLDPRSRSAMWTHIRELANEGMTVFLTTQYLEEADQIADAIAVMNNGMIVAAGTPAELKALIASDRLELHFSSQEDAAKGLELLRHIDAQSVSGLELHSRQDTGHGNERAALSHIDASASDKTVSVALSNAASDMRSLLNHLHNEQCIPVDIQLRKPTLDDVFMQLTAKGGEAE